MKALSGSTVLNRSNDSRTMPFAKMKAGNKVKLDKESSKLNSQGRALTVASRRGYMDKQGALNRPNQPLGRRMTAAMPSAEATTNIWGMEGKRATGTVRTYGRVETPSNHPNKRLNKIYG